MARFRNLRILQTKLNVETNQVWLLALDDQNQYWTIVQTPMKLHAGRQEFVQAFKDSLQPSSGGCPICRSNSPQVRLTITRDLNASDSKDRLGYCTDAFHGNWP